MTALYVRPAFASQYFGDRFPADTKAISNRLMCHALSSHQANRVDVLVVKLCQWVILALAFAVKNKVGHVFRATPPAEIAQSIVRCVAIVVTGLKAFGARAHKCFKNDDMDVCCASAAKPDEFPTVFVVLRGPYLLPRGADTPFTFVTRPYASVIGCRVADVIRDVRKANACDFREGLHAHGSQYNHQRTKGAER